MCNIYNIVLRNFLHLEFEKVQNPSEIKFFETHIIKIKELFTEDIQIKTL